jgi:hypothetical protein
MQAILLEWSDVPDVLAVRSCSKALRELVDSQQMGRLCMRLGHRQIKQFFQPHDFREVSLVQECFPYRIFRLNRIWRNWLRVNDLQRFVSTQAPWRVDACLGRLCLSELVVKIFLQAISAGNWRVVQVTARHAFKDESETFTYGILSRGLYRARTDAKRDYLQALENHGVKSADRDLRIVFWARDEAVQLARLSQTRRPSSKCLIC